MTARAALYLFSPPAGTVSIMAAAARRCLEGGVAAASVEPQRAATPRPVLVLDGGVSSRLAEVVAPHPLHRTLWSAGLVHPDGVPGVLDPRGAICRVHREFLDAGADIVSTVSYQATVPGFIAAGLAKTDDVARELVHAPAVVARSAIAGHLADAARAAEAAARARAPAETTTAGVQASARLDAAGGARSVFSRSSATWPGLGLRHPALDRDDAGQGSPILAVSVGPYGAFLADGSEYTGAYTLSDAELSSFHLTTLRAHLGADDDDGGVSDPGFVLAFETVPLRREAAVIAKLMRDHFPRVPFWISFQAAPRGRTAAGEPLDDCCRDLVSICYADAPAGGPPAATLVGVGVNCCSPSTAVEGVRAVASAVPSWCEVLSYPNSGELWDAERKQWLSEAHRAATEPSSSAATALEAAVASVAAGATIVGGCCRVGPDQIAQIKRALSGL
jgi:homocysteine S-methyltransferase